MNIAIAVDLSVESHFAVRWALELRAKARRLGQSVRCWAVCVPSPQEPFEFQSLAYPNSTKDPGVHRRISHRTRTFLESVDDDVDDVEVVVEEGVPAEILARFCLRHNVDWLVTGKSSVGPFARLFLGSTVHDLIDLSPCRLAIVHPEHARLDPPLQFAVGIDFLPGSEAALFSAAELSELIEARLLLIHALQDAPTGRLQGGLVNYLAGPDPARLTATARASLESMMGELERQYPNLAYDIMVHGGSPKKVLQDLIERHHVDIAFVGKVYHSTLERWALGSVARTLVKRMPCTLVLAPPAPGY